MLAGGGSGNDLKGMVGPWGGVLVLTKIWLCIGCSVSGVGWMKLLRFQLVFMGPAQKRKVCECVVGCRGCGVGLRKS